MPPTLESDVGVEVIDNDAALLALREEWERLWARVPDATPFQSPAWLLPWWEHVGRGRLATIALRAGEGELVGLAPLYVYEDEAAGLRHLFPLGIATTDVLDGLVSPGSEMSVLPALAEQLAAMQGDFDVLEVPQLRRGSVLLSLEAPAGWQRTIVDDEPHPVLDLRSPTAIPKRMRGNLRHARSRAERTGVLACETARDPQQVGDFLDALARLHGERWARRGEAGVLNEDVLAAHRATAPQLLAAGVLRLHALRVDGEIVAVLYCLIDRAGVRARRCSYYIGGFDPGHAALSPGTLLVGHAIEHARAEGAVAFDFLRGQEAYKYGWGAVDEPMVRMVWERIS